MKVDKAPANSELLTSWGRGDTGRGRVEHRSFDKKQVRLDRTTPIHQFESDKRIDDKFITVRGV